MHVLSGYTLILCLLAMVFVMSNILESYNLNISLINLNVSSFKIKKTVQVLYFDIL
jgi:hypothetical protein